MNPTAKSSEEQWLPARLIPTSGIKGVDEQERRATSALLAVMMAVPEFARSLLSKVRAPTGQLKTYIEPSFTIESGARIRPDGALVIRRGNTTWRALAEVKTSTNELDRSQVEAYLELARAEGFNALITISNQLGTATDAHPLTVDARKTKSVRLHHWSWVEILSEAVMQREYRGVSDPDQAWILGELIQYLQHPQSGAMEFQDMGPNWVAVRESTRDGTLRSNDRGVNDVIVRWDQFMQYLCLFLGRDLGVGVDQVLPRKEQNDPGARRTHLVQGLTTDGTLEGTLRIQRAIGDITLTASLRARTVTTSIQLEAPQDGRPTTRVNWLTRQLADASPDLRIDATFVGSRASTSCKLGQLIGDPAKLLLPDKSKAPRTFAVCMMADMGSKRGGVKGSFIGEATDLLLTFYRTVVQELRPWAGTAAKLPTQRDVADIATQPESVVERVASAQAEGLASNPEGESP